jgi:hypothetical protein
MASYQIFSAVVAVSFFIIVVVLIRRDKILMGSAFRWILIALGALVFGVYPSLVDRVAGWLDISYGPVLPLVLVSMFLLVKMLLTDIERAKTAVKLDRLNQKLALVELELKQLKSGVDEIQPSNVVPLASRDSKATLK